MGSLKPIENLGFQGVYKKLMGGNGGKFLSITAQHVSGCKRIMKRMYLEFV